MPAVDSLAVLLYQLDDMVAVLRLHNAAHFLRVVQAERHIRKLRHQLSATYKSQLTAVLRALGVLRVEPRQHREVSRTVHHTLRELAQTRLDTLRLFYRHGWNETQYLHLYLRWHHGDRVYRQTVVITAYLGGRRFDVCRQLLLHLLDNHLVTDVLHHFLTDLRTRLAEVLLHLLLRTDLRDVIVHTHIHLMAHRGFRHLYRVQLRLVQKQLLHRQLLGYNAIWVTGDCLTLVLRTQPFLLHLRSQDSFVTYDPDHFVNDVLVRHTRHGEHQHTYIQYLLHSISNFTFPNFTASSYSCLRCCCKNATRRCDRMILSIASRA